jgi:hypothetical protein
MGEPLSKSGMYRFMKGKFSRGLCQSCRKMRGEASPPSAFIEAQIFGHNRNGRFFYSFL